MINRRNILKALGIGAGAAAVPVATGAVLAAGPRLSRTVARPAPTVADSRIEGLRWLFLGQAQKACDVQTVHVSYTIVDSEFGKSDEEIARRYFEPACRELKDMAISLRSSFTSVRVETQRVGSDEGFRGEPGLRVTVYADLQCPWDREPDHDAWKELESQLFIWLLYEDGSMLEIPAFRQGKSVMAPYEGKDAVITNKIAVQRAPSGTPLEDLGPNRVVSSEIGTSRFVAKSEPLLPRYSRKVTTGDMLMVKTS